jgi:protein gp37
MGRAGTWGAEGTRERTSDSNWKKPLRWNRLAEEGKLPDGKPNLDGHRPRVFCASLADVFEPRPELAPWRADLFGLIEATPALDWLVLTKRPEEARDWLLDFYVTHGARGVRSANAGQLDYVTGTIVIPEVVEWETFGREWTSRDRLGWGVLPNVWLGTSIENARFTWRADVLRDVPAAVRFISAEPLLGSLFPYDRSTDGDPLVPRHQAPGHADGDPARPRRRGTRSAPDGDDLGPHGDMRLADPAGDRVRTLRASLDLTGIDWVICGGESGPDFRPMNLDHARELRDACAEAGTAFFYKQGSGRFPGKNATLDGVAYKAFPEVEAPVARARA